MTPCAHYRQWSDGIQWVPLYVFILQGHSSSGTGTSQAENMVVKKHDKCEYRRADYEKL